MGLFKAFQAAALSTTALAMMGTTAQAQDQGDDGTTAQSSGPTLNRIVVTARKREEDLQDVPSSVSAISGDTIATVGIQKIEDAVTYIPNVVVSRQSIGDNINIRGIQSGNQAGFEQSVGTFVDGVYRGRGVQSRFAFLDVGTLEVLRGPQGTLFGKNVVAGALNIRSAGPEDYFTGAIRLGYNPTFDEVEARGHITGPLSDNLRARVAFLHREMEDGWVTNQVYDSGTPQTDDQAVRGILEWDAGDNTTIMLKAEYGQFNNVGRPFEHIQAGPLALVGVEGELDGFQQIGSVQAGSPLNTVFGLPTDSVQELGTNLRLEGDLFEGVLRAEHEFGNGTLTGIASFSRYDFTRLLDADYNPADVANFHENEAFDQTSFEIRYASDPDARFDYIVGAYYNNNDLESRALSIFSLTTIGALLSADCALNGGVTVPFDPFTDDPNVALTQAVAANYGTTNAAVANSCAQASLIAPVVASGLLANNEGVSGVSRFARLDQNTETFALFGAATFDLTDSWSVTGGLRYTNETKTGQHVTSVGEYERTYVPTDITTPVGQLKAALASLAGEYVPFDTGVRKRSESNFTWDVNTQLDISPDVMVYASASTGFKSGGFNTFYFSLAPTADGAEFEDESVLSFEVGSKMTLADGALELNIAAFRTEYKDLQVSIFSGNTTFEVANAAEAVTQGLEIDGRWQATRELMISGGLGLIDFEFESFPNQACTNDQFLAFREDIYNDPNNAFSGITPALAALLINNGSCAQAGINDLSGRTASQTPEFSSTLAFSYERPIGSLQINTTLDFLYRSEIFRQDDLDPLLIDDADLLVNATIALSSPDSGWRVGVVGKNLTNVDDSFGFGNDVPLAPNAVFVGLNPPRSFQFFVGFEF